MQVYLNGVNVKIVRGGAFQDIEIPVEDTRLLQWVGSDRIGVFDEITGNEYVDDWDNIFDENNALYGANYQEVVDALAQFVGGLGGGQTPPNETVVNINAGQQVVTTVDEVDFRHLVVEAPKPPQKYPNVGVIDPDNVAGNEAQFLIDGIYNNLCFNDDSPSTNNKSMPAIDLGQPEPVNQISIWWWNAAYNSSNFKIQGSNDGVAFTDVVTNQSSVGIVGRQDIPVSGTFRYWRVFCVVGVNPVYIVLSEMEAYGTPIGVDRTINHAEDKVDILVDDNGKIIVKNNTALNIVVKIKH